MGRHATKAAENIYFRCRNEASRYNDKLKSREGASDLLGLSVSSLADYELGITKVVPVDKVVLMADLYNTPELKNYYCTHECPLGVDNVPELEIAELDRLALKILSAFKNVSKIRESIIDIAADGIISTDEIPTLESIINDLDVITKNSQELKLWVTKNLKLED